MSRRRRKPKETHLLIEHPPHQRGKREANRVLDLLDQIASEKPNREEANR